MTNYSPAQIPVWEYHQKTKHSLQQYAKGPEALDWDEQPEAFRWFDGAPKIDLPLVADNVHTPFVELYKGVTPQPLTLDNIACLLELSFGLSAWKEYGDARWALRCNPSSGNLHAEEAYLITNQNSALPAGVHHYMSRDHQLEQRCTAPVSQPDDTLLLGLSSIQWREAWKYGERAYRYCQLDTGHAIAAVRYAAAALGWQVHLIDQISDTKLATLLGLGREEDFGAAEQEAAEVLLQITAGAKHHPVDLATLPTTINNGQWAGQANALSNRHMYDWPILDQVTESAHKPATDTPQPQLRNLSEPLPSACELEANLLIRRRRSAQAFDGQTHIDRDAFFRILDMTLPRADTAPWDATPWRDSLNLVLFVHRVNDLPSGLYTLIRNPETEADYKQALSREQFQWQAVEGCPDHLPLYRLVQANGQKLAATLSCHQGIAGQSCFSLAMIGDCRSIDEHSWHYRRLYWEAGMIGQVLYLEAEAAGIQGTGIGCYFDDSVHEVLGITDKRWQTLYHFTVGKGIQDGRIQTTPPYQHLKR